MNVGAYRRTKHGAKPGDVCKSEKIEMREHPSASRRARTFNNIVVRKGNKRLRRWRHDS